MEVGKEAKIYKEEVRALSDKDIQAKIELAQAYNYSLNNYIEEDPFSENEKEEGKKHYAKMLEIREKIGYVQIPKINENIPIYAGTSEEILQIGAGHMEGTSLPIGGINSHSVITAHSGLPTATLFSNLEDLVIGDKFFIHNLKETLAYQVDQILVIDPYDFSNLLIEEGKDYITLLTCTPIMVNSHRLIVRGHRVEYIEGEESILTQDSLISTIYMYAFYFTIAIIIIALILISLYGIRIKKAKKKMLKIEASKLDEGKHEK